MGRLAAPATAAWKRMQSSKPNRGAWRMAGPPRAYGIGWALIHWTSRAHVCHRESGPAPRKSTCRWAGAFFDVPWGEFLLEQHHLACLGEVGRPHAIEVHAG